MVQKSNAGRGNTSRFVTKPYSCAQQQKDISPSGNFFYLRNQHADTMITTRAERSSQTIIIVEKSWKLLNNFANEYVKYLNINSLQSMFFRIIIIPFCFILLISSSTVGQTATLEGDERAQMIRDVMAAYPQEFRRIDIQSIYRLDEHYAVMTYQSAGTEWEAVLQVDGIDPILVETGQKLSKDEWPDMIVDAFRQGSHARSSIIAIFKVSTPYGEQGYRANLQTDESDPVVDRLYFDAFGRPLKPFF